jgi:hypothetical protein
MSRIPQEMIEYKLGIDPSFKPIKQKERRYTLDRREAIRQEVNRLLKAGFIRLVDYPIWVANPVLIKKLDGSWRMCINYTCLNKACPKDEYPPTSYMSNCGFHYIMWVTIILGCLLQLSSNQPGYWGWREDNFHQIICSFLLYEDGVRSKKWRCYISEGHVDYSRTTNHKKHQSIHWWCCSEVKKARGSAWRPQEKLQQSP